MEATSGFDVLNRCRNTRLQSFLTLVRPCQRVVKMVGRTFLAGRLLNVFACSSTTKSQGNKRMLPSDSTHSEGAEIPFHRVLTVDDDGLWQW